jgi:hypothetical protein
MAAFFRRRVNLYKKRDACIRLYPIHQAIGFMHMAACALAKGVQAMLMNYPQYSSDRKPYNKIPQPTII